MTLKEHMRRDAKATFLNPAEFGEEHNVIGKKMQIIIDDNELTVRKKRMQSHMDGMHVIKTLVYVSASDYGPLPGIGKQCVIDGVPFTVTDSLNEGGVYSLHLESNRS